MRKRLKVADLCQRALSRRASRGQRGSVAVEFALVFPLFLGTLGLMISLGTGMWARYQLISYATNAARACAFTTPVSDASVSSCVPQMVSQSISAAPITWCQPGSPVVSVQRATGSVDPKIHIVSVALSCNMSWMPFINVLPGASATGTYQVSGRSAMPFLIP